MTSIATLTKETHEAYVARLTECARNAIEWSVCGDPDSLHHDYVEGFTDGYCHTFRAMPESSDIYLPVGGDDACSQNYLYGFYDACNTLGCRMIGGPD